MWLLQTLCLNREKLKAFSLMSGTKQSSYSFKSYTPLRLVFRLYKESIKLSTTKQTIQILKVGYEINRGFSKKK